MIEKYNPLNGVPSGHYYIEETKQFADFELDWLREITFISDSKQELIDLCIENKWRLPEAKNCDSWFTHYIRLRE